MNKAVAFLIVSGVLFCHSQILGQTDPGNENLIHQWTFDDGTPDDAVNVNPVNGTLMGGASIADNALVLSSEGQHLSFSGTDLALGAYPTITQEIWYTSIAGANTGYTMLSYFGGTDGTLGYNYISTSTARGDNISRTAITNGTYDKEIRANGPEYDDGLLHHMVSIISPDSVILYIDGELADKTPNTIPLSAIDPSIAYLGKGGYSNDPTWKGTISLFSIYNRPLTAGEVKFLFQKGAEHAPLIVTSATHFSFDDLFLKDVFTISGFNLTDPIVISAPDGITVSEAALDPGVKDVALTVSYDGVTAVDGNIILTSGDQEKIIPVKSFNNDCYTPLYEGIPNLITDPYFSSLANFSGWGDRRINTDPAYVYCGATSGMISGYNSGSIDVSLTGKLQPNTVYRVRANVLTTGGNFQVGMFGWSRDQGDINHRFDTDGLWKELDISFTTGNTLGSSQGLFFNNYGLSGTTGYIDNWECYAVPKVYASVSALDFITPSSKNLHIRGVNLNTDISISTPAGFNASPTTFSPDANGEQLTITFSGSESTSGYVYFTSGTVQDSLFVSGSVAPLLTTSVTQVTLDEINNSMSFAVSGYNLTSNVTLNVPNGITLSHYTLPTSLRETTVDVMFDGVANSSGEIAFKSGNYSISIPLEALLNEECFTPLYDDRKNLISDPTCNSYMADGWGGRRINDDPAYIYCGARSGEITGNGSFDRDLTGVMQPNTTYRVKAKVYKKSPVQGDNMGNVTYTLALDSTTHPEAYRLITTAMDSACYYFNKFTPFIHDIYVYYSAGIPTAQASYHGSIGFGPNTRYMWVGTAIHEMAHYFGSGTTSVWQSKISNGVWTGTVANELMKSINDGVIYGDSQHYWPYGINQREEITNMGSQSVQDKALADAVRVLKAMLVDDCGLPTNNPPVGVGVYGWDALSDDIYHEVTLANTWQEIDFTFTTGNTMKESQGVFFNSGHGYIDNWEMYDLSTTPVGIVQEELPEFSVFVADNLLTISLELPKDTNVRITVYDMQGKLISDHQFRGYAGMNVETLDASQLNGLYLVKVQTDHNFNTSRKIIK